MLGMSNEERVTKSHATALRKARILKCLSRKDLAKKLNVSYKAIEKIENGRDKLSEERLQNIIKAIGITHEEFLKIKQGKKIITILKPKKVITNIDRRSYQRLITKEVRVLKSLRKMREISQDQASALCGYSRPTIGHIENGRISLDKERIAHIVNSYGFTSQDFDRYIQMDRFRDEIIDHCVSKLNKLTDDKLSLALGVIDSLG